MPPSGLRRTYVGELGWELYRAGRIRRRRVYEALHEAGADFGLRDAGYYAVETLCASRRATAPGAAS